MQEYWTTLWEHLEDLRATFLRSLVVIGAGFLILLMFYQPILQFLTSYTLNRLKKEYVKREIQRIQVTNQTTEDQIFELPSHGWLISNSSLVAEKEHFYRLAPGQTLLYEEASQLPLLIMGPIEGMTLVFKICFWFSVMLTSPFWGWIWLQFILPGLKEQERALLFPFLISSFLCLVSGLILAYYVTLPIANQYLFLFNASIGQNAWTLIQYVNYILLLFLGHVVAAELILIL